MRKCTKTIFSVMLVAVFLLSAMATLPVSASSWDPSLGWDFQCHTNTHPDLTSLTDAQIRAELQAVNDAFTAHGYATPTQHAYPGGSHDARVESIVAEYRQSGRMVWGFYVTYPVPNWYQLKGAQLKKSTSWNRIKGWIDDTIKDKGLLVILSHDVSARPSVWGTTPALLGQTLDYLVQKRNAGQLQICTMSEAYDIWSTATTNPLPTAVVSFDDANESDFTTVYPMFKARGIKGTSFITTSFIDQPGSLTWAEIAQMRAGT